MFRYLIHGRGREIIVRTNLRILIAVIWSSLLFAIFLSIRNLFEVPFWKPFAGFLVVFSLLAVIGCNLSKIPFPKKVRSFFDHVFSLHQHAEEVLYSHITDTFFFFLLWILLTVCYIPAYLAFFPGIFGYDTPIQVAEYYGYNELSSHHPLVHTFLMGAFFSLGEKLFHCAAAGFALYTALQGIVVSASISYCLTVCKKRRIPLLCILLGAIWYVINPYLQILSMNSTKDTLFGAFLLCFGTACWDFLETRTPGRYQYILLIASGILTCLFRNQGIYILGVLLLACLFLRIPKKGLCLSLLACLLTSQSFFTFCSAGLGIPKGDLSEMLCVPMQQMACAAYLNETNEILTPQQLTTLLEIIPLEGIREYNVTSADPVKAYFQTQNLFKDLGKHLKNYIEIGLQNPAAYFHSWLNMIHPYWKTTDNEYSRLALSYTFPEQNRWGIRHAPILNRYYLYLSDKLYLPEEKFYTRPELCLWLLAGFSGFAIARGKKKWFFSILPFALYLGTILLGPVALLRYLYPLTLATPLLFCMFFQPPECTVRSENAGL